MTAPRARGIPALLGALLLTVAACGGTDTDDDAATGTATVSDAPAPASGEDGGTAEGPSSGGVLPEVAEGELSEVVTHASGITVRIDLGERAPTYAESPTGGEAREAVQVEVTVVNGSQEAVPEGGILVQVGHTDEPGGTAELVCGPDPFSCEESAPIDTGEEHTHVLGFTTEQGAEIQVTTQVWTEDAPLAGFLVRGTA